MAGLLDELSPEVAGALVAGGTRRRYPARSFLFHEGEEATSALILETGLVRVDRTLRSGRQLLITLATPGDLLGELAVIDGEPRSATAATVTESRLVVIPGRAFVAALDAHPELSLAVLRRVSRRLRVLTDQFSQATSQTATGRVAARLLELASVTSAPEPGDGPVELTLPITQEELGQWAGLSREGTVKGLGELRSAGIIATGRRRITIHDPDGLRRLAERLLV